MARRRYQKGSLLERNGNWVGRWREDVIEDGVVKRPYRNLVLGSKKDFPTKRLAQRELDSRLAYINRPDYRATPTTTFGDFAAKWKLLVLPQLKGSTQLTLKSQLKTRLMPALENVVLKDVSAPLLQSYVATWARAGLSRHTIKGAVMTLRTLWKTAKAWGYANHDPFVGLVFPAVQRTEQRFFTVDEIRQIIAAAPEPYKTFYWLAAETGMRAGELIGLRLQDVNIDEGIVRVRQSVWRGRSQTPKTQNAQRGFALSPELQEHLRGVLSRRGTDLLQFLFHTRNGTPWDYTDLLRRRFKPLLKRLGLPDAGLHAFRHGNATLMNQLHADPKTQQGRLGHSDMTMTMNYTHAINAEDRKIAAEIGRVFAPFCTDRGNDDFVESTAWN